MKRHCQILLLLAVGCGALILPAQADKALQGLTNVPGYNLPISTPAIGFGFRPNGVLVVFTVLKGSGLPQFEDWNIVSRARVRLVRTNYRRYGRHSHFANACFSRDCSVAAAFEIDGSGKGRSYVDLWDTASGRLLHSYRCPNQPNPDEIALSPNGRYIAAVTESDQDKTATVRTEGMLFDTATGKRSMLIDYTDSGDYAGGADVAFSPASSVVICEYSQKIRVIDLRTRRLVRRISAPLNPDAMAFSPHGRWLAGLLDADDPHHAVFYSTSGWVQAHIYKIEPMATPDAIGWSPNGKYVVVEIVGDGDEICLLQVDTAGLFCDGLVPNSSVLSNFRRPAAMWWRRRWARRAMPTP